MCVMYCIGSKVEFPAIPAQLFGCVRLLFFKNVFRRELMILDNSFCIVSNRTIGRVLDISHSQLFGLGIGNNKAFFQSDGIIPVENIRFKKSSKYS